MSRKRKQESMWVKTPLTIFHDERPPIINVAEKESDNANEEGKAKKLGVESFDSDAKSKDGKLWNLKIVSWNVDGLRAWLKKDGLSIIKKEDPDIMCLQEIKCSESKLPPELNEAKKNYNAYYFAAQKEGYAGVALFSKVKPLSVKKGLGDPTHDDEGRCITAEFEDFFLVTAYVPNSGKKLITMDKRMDWDPKLQQHLKDLDEKKPVIYCGDLNVAHKEIDLANPKSNKRNAGFTQEERDGFSNLLKEGFVDSYRELYPDKKDQYTFWTYMMGARARNVGWRLDYFVLSERLLPRLCDNIMRSSVLGSDHCPTTLLIHFDKK